MSHFTVLVVGDDVEKSLAPFHEFECTGLDDEYVQDLDLTSEKMEEYKSQMISKLQNSKGTLFNTYDDKFYRDPITEEEKNRVKHGGSGCGPLGSYTSKDRGDGKGYRAKIRFVPDDYIEVEVKYSDINTFREYIEDYEEISIIPYGQTPDISGKHKYNYALENENGQIIKVVRRTNPNDKRDWYSIGGRRGGQIKLKEDAKNKYDAPGSSRCSDPEEVKKLSDGLHTDSAYIKDIENLDEIITFAVIKDGQRYSRGEMGRRGIVHSETMEKDERDTKLKELLHSLDGDTRITIVDCHI